MKPVARGVSILLSLSLLALASLAQAAQPSQPPRPPVTYKWGDNVQQFWPATDAYTVNYPCDRSQDVEQALSAFGVGKATLGYSCKRSPSVVGAVFLKQGQADRAAVTQAMAKIPGVLVQDAYWLEDPATNPARLHLVGDSGEMIVKFKDDATMAQIAAAITKFDLTIESALIGRFYPGDLILVKKDLTQGRSTFEIAEALNAEPGVEYSEANLMGNIIDLEGPIASGGNGGKGGQ